MTVPTTTEIEQEDGNKNTEKVKNTAQNSYRADRTLYRRRWNPTGFQHIFQEIKMNRHL